MSASDTNSEVGVSVLTDQANQAIGELSQQFSKFSEEVHGHFEGLSSISEKFTATIEKIKGAFVAVTAVLAGGKLFGEAVSETIELTKEVNKLSMVLGISRQEAQALATGLEMIGQSSEAYLGTIQRLTMKLKSNEEGFNAVGIATRDADGNFLNGQEVMANTIKHLDNMKAGTDRNVEATTLLGRNWVQSLLYGRLNKEMLEEIKAKQAALDMQITGTSVEAMYKYMGAMVEAKEVFKAVALSAGQEMMPRLTEMAEWFASIGPSVVAAFNESLKTFILVTGILKDTIGLVVKTMLQGFGQIGQAISATFGGESLTLLDYFMASMKLLQVIIIGLGAAFETVFAVINGVVGHTMGIIMAFVGAAAEALTDSPAGMSNKRERVKAAWANGMQGAVDAVVDSSKKIKEIDDKMKADILAVYTPPAIKEPDVQKKDGETHKTPAAASTALADAQKELKLLEAQEDVYHEHSKEMEVDFWTAKLATVKRGTDDYIQMYELLRAAQKALVKEIEAEDKKALEVKIAAAHLHKDQQLAIASEYAEKVLAKYVEDSDHYRAALKEKVKYEDAFNKEIEAIKKVYVERDKDRRLADIAAEEEMVKFKKDIGITEAVAEVKELNALEAQKYRIKIDALKAEADMENIAEKDRQERINRLKAMEQEFANWQIASEHKVALSVKQEWESTLSPISAAFSTSIKGMIQGTQTWQKSLANIGQSILGEFINMVVTMGVRWAALEAYKLATTTAGSAERVALDEATSIASLIKAKLTALGLIQTSAAVGAAGAYSATAVIPYVGPFLAPAAALEAYAAIESFSALAIAQQGYDIPAGINPIVQAHAREMILPEEQADVIRSLAASGSKGGGQDFHYHDHTGTLSDATIQANARKIAKALGVQARNFYKGT